MHVKIKMAEISSDEEELVATLMLMKDLKKEEKGKLHLLGLGIFTKREKKKALTICLLGK